MRSTLVMTALVGLLAAPGFPDDRLAGRWDVTMDRGAAWQPRVCRATLVLSRVDGRSTGDAATWSGSLRFETILYGRRHALRAIEVDGSDVAFQLDSPEFHVGFEASLEDERLEGTCAWRGAGRFSWTAARDDGAPLPRFDEDLSFDRGLRRGDAENLGMDGDALDLLVRRAAENGTDVLLIVKDGRVVCERNFGGDAGPIHLMSVTKFFTAMAAAWLLEEEAISLDDPVSRWYPEWSDGAKAGVTLRHLLAHTSGILHRPSARRLNEQGDKVAFVRGIEMEAEPGTRIAYSNEGVALLSGILGDAAGEPVDRYLERRLFAPLDIDDYAWDRDEAGNTITYAQLAMTARDLARVGQLLVEEGRRGGKRIFPRRWIDTLSTPGSPHGAHRGLLWRIYRHPETDEPIGFGHTGWLGQHFVVLPDHALVGIRLRRFKSAADADDPARSFGGFAGLLVDTLAE